MFFYHGASRSPDQLEDFTNPTISALNFVELRDLLDFSSNAKNDMIYHCDIYISLSNKDKQFSIKRHFLIEGLVDISTCAQFLNAEESVCNEEHGSPSRY